MTMHMENQSFECGIVINGFENLLSDVYTTEYKCTFNSI